MSFQVKVASVAAVVFSAFMAMTAADASFALDTVSSPSVPTTVSEPAPRLAVADVSDLVISPNADGSVTVAPRREIVQPLPTADQADSLAELVEQQNVSADLDAETRCLAAAVYFEAGGETLPGRLAVADVVLNRVESGRFASSVCGVVFQPSQFSFVRGNDFPPIKMESRRWHEAVAIARIAQADGWKSEADGALYFHARSVSPGWRMKRLASIDNHVFYR